MRDVTTLAKHVDTASGAGSAGLDRKGMARYQVCELVVESNVFLPELTPTELGNTDCRFEVMPAGEGFAGELQWFHDCPSPDNETWLRFAERGEDYLLRFRDQGDFLISRDGTRVRCRPLPGTTESTIRHLFLDQIVPLVLSRRESLVLHASAILTPAGVIAFVGKSGQGKSTLAASFGQSGSRLISDDYLVLRKTVLRKTVSRKMSLPKNANSGLTEKWIAIPSYPGVRLWPETSDGIFKIPPKSAEVSQYTNKRRVSDPALVPFAEGPSALRSLYFLDEEEEDDAYQAEPAISRLSPSKAFMKLVSCAFNLDIRDKTMLERQFEAIGQISTQLPCFQLDYARNFATLAGVRQLIVEQEMRSAA